MSVMTGADDLLKTRTIPELRKLVYSLASDADGKQAELRSMVELFLLFCILLFYNRVHHSITFLFYFFISFFISI